MAQNNLIINFEFNPPQVKIIGQVRETTIEKLNQVLASSTTSTRGTRFGSPKFIYESSPPHWRIVLDGQYCNQVGISALFLAVLDAVEEEGGWGLKSTHALTMEDPSTLQQEFYESYKFFFHRRV